MSWTDTYQYYLVDQADPRSNKLFLVSNPLGVTTILLSYLYFVLVAGPRFMQRREPYSCKTFIYYYNIFQIVSNVYLVYSFINSGWLTHYSLGCEPVRYENEPQHWRMVYTTYLTYLLKMIDLVETAVFVFRKKWNQISFLHVYHHVSTVVVTYLALKYTPGGMMSMLMIINGSVHVMMYSYYLLASLGPNVQNTIKPAKPYITSIQIIQFLFLMLHQSQGFLPSCSIPNCVPSMMVGNLMINLILFSNFYSANYKKNHKSA